MFIYPKLNLVNLQVIYLNDNYMMKESKISKNDL